MTGWSHFNMGDAPFLSLSIGEPLDFLGYGLMKRRMLEHRTHIGVCSKAKGRMQYLFATPQLAELHLGSTVPSA